MNDDALRNLIRTIPDYPKPGILFRDITTLLKDGDGWGEVVDRLVTRYGRSGIAGVAGIEARGFILGGAVAAGLGAGFIPIRKRGKLPATVEALDYQLEYGSDRVEVHRDAVDPGQRILLVDDLIATGGTAVAARDLLRGLGAAVVEAAFVIELPALAGRARLETTGTPVHALLAFDGH
jgi:adenine phosphoribosyltransferase